MRWRTEDLLSLRDGEPLAATERQRLESLPEARHEVRRLTELREALRALPGLEPPPAAWSEIRAELARPRRTSRRPHRARALAACTALALFGIGFFATRPLWDPSGTPVAGARVDQRASRIRPLASELSRNEHRALLRESARLESALRLLPPQQAVMSASTASTIAGLEDQIAWIDVLMSESAARDPGGDDAGYRETLWRERINMMNALVEVRYAHTPAQIY